MSTLIFKIKDEFISDSTQLVADAVTIHYVEIIDKYYDASRQKVPDDYQWNDRAPAYYEYGFDIDGTMVPVIILEVEADRDDEDRDKYYYIGQVSIDGSAYDKWIKINNPKTHVPIEGWTSNTKQFIYTNVIVEEVQIQLNNFGLAEITLKTANKWCTADIKVKIDSAELENIKPEYLRSGVEVFGISGTYGEAVDTVIIPAGIYEIIYNPTSERLYPTDINFYYCRGAYDRFEVENDSCIDFSGSNGGTTRVFDIGSSAVEPSPEVTWLDHLVYVPNDVSTLRENAEMWYSIMHPYVSCKHQGTGLILTPAELAKLIMPCSHEESDVYGTKLNDSSHNIYCSDCHALLRTETHSYDDSGYCFCGARKPIPPDPGSTEGGDSNKCNHDLDYGTISWNESGEGYHTARCKVCNEEVGSEPCNYIDYQCEKCGAYQIIGYCSVCGGDIRYNSDYVDYNGSLLHSSCSTGDSGGDEKLYHCGGYLGEGQYCNNSGPYGETCPICWQQFTND